MPLSLSLPLSRIDVDIFGRFERSTDEQSRSDINLGEDRLLLFPLNLPMDWQSTEQHSAPISLVCSPFLSSKGRLLLTIPIFLISPFFLSLYHRTHLSRSLCHSTLSLQSNPFPRTSSTTFKRSLTCSSSQRLLDRKKR